jgi:5'-3' exoribonuclease 1
MRAVGLIRQFVAAWPRLIAALNAQPREAKYLMVSLLPPPLPADPLELAQHEAAFVSSFLSWQSTHGPEKRLKFVSAGTQMLHPETVKKIDAMVPPTKGVWDEFPESLVKVSQSKLTNHASAQSATGAQLHPGDRCIYRLTSGPVRAGLHGTVISRYGKLIEVIFDSAFLSGTTLSGSISQPRGAILSVDAVIPLSLEHLARACEQTPAKKSDTPVKAAAASSSKQRNPFALLDEDSD